MKKLFFILSVSTYVLIGCHSNNNSGQPVNPNADKTVIDTSKMQVMPQAADTTVKDGKRTLRYPNGIIKEVSYFVAGRKQGECQSFYESGKLMSDCFFTAGLSDGPCTAYYENGQKRYEGNFTKGKMSGTWKFYDDTGKLTRSKTYGTDGGNSPI